MKKKIFLGLFMFILLAITFGLYSLNKKLDPASANGLPVNANAISGTATVAKHNILSVVQASGNVKAEESEEFSLEPGKKVKYYVEDGEEVSKGRLLYQIQDLELELQYKQALADKKQMTKVSSAVATNTSIMPAAGPSLKDINSQINALKERLDANKVRAPFAGIVSIIDNPAGTPGNQLITIKISNPSSLIIPVNIEEEDYPLIKVGQKATVKLTAYGDSKFQGSVLRISKEAFNKDGTVTIPVMIKLTQNPRILPGMSAEVSIAISSKSNVLALPSEYIQQNEKGENIVNFIPKGSTENKNNNGNSETPLQVKIVKTGLKDDTHTEIISGLKEGDVVQANVPQASATSVNQAQ